MKQTIQYEKKFHLRHLCLWVVLIILILNFNPKASAIGFGIQNDVINRSLFSQGIALESIRSVKNTSVAGSKIIGKKLLFKAWNIDVLAGVGNSEINSIVVSSALQFSGLFNSYENSQTVISLTNKGVERRIELFTIAQT